MPGLQELRNEALIDLDQKHLSERMQRYFNADEPFAVLQEDDCGLVRSMARFEASRARNNLLKSEVFRVKNLRRFHQRVFEEKWCYHTTTRPIWNDPRPELAAIIGPNNPALVSRAYRERPNEGPHVLLTTALPDYHLLRPNCAAITFFRADGTSNLSPFARAWLAAMGMADPDADKEIAALP
jgi:hypothetical protein